MLLSADFEGLCARVQCVSSVHEGCLRIRSVLVRQQLTHNDSCSQGAHIATVHAVCSPLALCSNLCYGEGGAGTWSDGKLTTRIGRNSGKQKHTHTYTCIHIHL
jgi:hypothetical protein